MPKLSVSDTYRAHNIAIQRAFPVHPTFSNMAAIFATVETKTGTNPLDWPTYLFTSAKIGDPDQSFACTLRAQDDDAAALYVRNHYPEEIKPETHIFSLYEVLTTHRLVLATRLLDPSVKV